MHFSHLYAMIRRNFIVFEGFMLKSLVGDRHFYGRVLRIAVPIFMQNIITNFVSLLDNLMVGQLGTLPMSGVAVVNQLLFVFNLVCLGSCTGTGIFTAQYYGRNDMDGIRHTLRLRLSSTFSSPASSSVSF